MMPTSFRSMPVALLIAVLAGCATGQSATPMDPQDRAALKSAPVVHVVRYVSGYMNLMTPTSATSGMGGLLPGAIQRSTGSAELPAWHELERNYGYPSATEELSAQLVQKLKSNGLGNLRIDPKPLMLPAAEDPAVYRSKYGNGLLLEVTVPGRGAVYGVMGWKTYYYSMLGQARLIRLSDSKVLWADTCNINDRNDPGLTFDVSEFEANNGARMKQVIRYSSDLCSRILADKLLGKSA